MKITKNKEESISDLMHRIHDSYILAELDKCPLETLVLLHLLTLLPSDPLSEKVKNWLVESMRVEPNIEKVELLAAMAVRDEAYMRDVEHVRNQSKLENVEKASELRQLRGDWKELSVISLDRGDLIIRGDREILITKAGGQELVDQLHTTHLLYQGMRNLARNKFFWPGMESALEKKYISCQNCKTNSVSNHDKTIQVVPE